MILCCLALMIHERNVKKDRMSVVNQYRIIECFQLLSIHSVILSEKRIERKAGEHGVILSNVICGFMFPCFGRFWQQ